ncbi:putative CAAX prenyl protease 2 [Helianthus annuus]|nr:putative CAAX prenyl protease 2 [Helianthus annuus]
MFLILEFLFCMISLLLCGGFKLYTVILLSPVLFSLAHLNHLLEFYMQQNSSLLKASMVVGFQLGYTVIFGSYASFLFVRTGWLVSMGFVAGEISFIYILFPLTSPALYHPDPAIWAGQPGRPKAQSF